MRKFALTCLALSAALLFARTPAIAAPSLASTSKPPLVEFEMMTWPEVKAALAAGKTTALFYTGGTEQRGPQDVNGGHTLMGRATVKAIALKLGNAIAMPVLPYTPNNASAEFPGTIGLTNDLLAAILERLSEQAIVTGFKNVILMGDHGDGQEPGPTNVYRAVAKKLDTEYAGKGIHVYYCDQVYAPANADFEKYLIAHGYPAGDHGAVPDTSEMLYLGDGNWVRQDLIAHSLGDPVLPPGQKPAPNAHLVNNGITGDGRRSSVALGKIFFNMKVDYAVRQIRGFLGKPGH
jgi:creatinine amidohydrolase/Fe(II)-dependent formamide hydrolase-like protein